MVLTLLTHLKPGKIEEQLPCNSVRLTVGQWLGNNLPTNNQQLQLHTVYIFTYKQTLAEGIKFIPSRWAWGRCRGIDEAAQWICKHFW